MYFEFGGKDAKEIIDTLNSLEGFDENGLCHCAPNYNVSFDGKSFGLRLDDEAYARHDGGQISISSRVAYKLLDILERNIVLENRVYPEAEQNELMLTVRDQNTILRYVAKDKNTKLLLEFALKADYTEGDLPYDAEYKLGFEYKEPSRFALSLKGDAPFIASENGIYYLKADQTKALKDAIESISTKQNQIEAKQSYEEPYQARVAATAYPDGAEKYMFYNEDSDELLLLLESYFYQSVNGGCSCQPSVCITPTHLRNEHPRANSYIVAFCADSTHVYTDSGHRHAVVSYEDGERIKEILYKNCK